MVPGANVRVLTPFAEKEMEAERVSVTSKVTALVNGSHTWRPGSLLPTRGFQSVPRHLTAPVRLCQLDAFSRPPGSRDSGSRDSGSRARGSRAHSFLGKPLYVED